MHSEVCKMKEIKYLFSYWKARQVLSLLILFCALPLSGAEQRPYPAEIQRIMERGELVVLTVSFDERPFQYVRNGRLEGFEADMGRDLAQGLGIGVRFKRIASSYDDVVERIANGEADLAISTLSRTLDRAKMVRFSEPYLEMKHAMAINRARLAELALRKDPRHVIQNFPGSIGVRANSSYMGFAKTHFPNAKIVGYPSWAEAIAAAIRGDVDVLYSMELDIRRLFTSDSKHALQFQQVIFNDLTDELAMALPPDSLQLLSITNLYLTTRKKTVLVKDLVEMASE